MAKQIKVGSVIKGKVDPDTGKAKPDYIQLSSVQVAALKGVLANLGKEDKLFINLESKASQLASLDAAVANGKLTEEYVEKQKKFVEKIPEFVRFELTTLVRD